MNDVLPTAVDQVRDTIWIFSEKDKELTAMQTDSLRSFQNPDIETSPENPSEYEISAEQTELETKVFKMKDLIKHSFKNWKVGNMMKFKSDFMIMQKSYTFWIISIPIMIMTFLRLKNILDGHE